MDSADLAKAIDTSRITLRKYSEALSLDVSWFRGRKTTFNPEEVHQFLCIKALKESGFTGPEACQVIADAWHHLEKPFDQNPVWLFVHPDSREDGSLHVSVFTALKQIEPCLLRAGTGRVIAFNLIANQSAAAVHHLTETSDAG